MAFVRFKPHTGRKPVVMPKDKAIRLQRVIDGLDEASEAQKAYANSVLKVYFAQPSDLASSQQGIDIPEDWWNK